MEFHEIANCFPLVTGQAFTELCNDIKANGQLATIVVFENKILDGRNRYRACEAVGIKPRTTVFEGDYQAAIRTVISLNLQRRHMSDAEKAMAAAEVANLKDGNPHREKLTGSIEPVKPAVSRSDAASMFSVPEAAVKRAAVLRDHAVPEVREAVRRGDVALSTGADIARALPEAQPVMVRADLTAQQARTFASQTPEVQRAAVAAPEPVEAVREASKPHVIHNSGNFEWYTPSDVIEKARKVLGGIDLDPASSTAANEVVKAAKIYTIDDPGLDKPWYAKSVWMNPPFASDLIQKFTEKLTTEITAGRVKSAIVFANNATETAWFQNMAKYADAIHFPRSRIKCWAPDKTTTTPLQGQVILYFGDKPLDFMDVFQDSGVTLCHLKSN